jgi:hypothetical protein
MLWQQCIRLLLLPASRRWRLPLHWPSHDDCGTSSSWLPHHWPVHLLLLLLQYGSTGRPCCDKHRHGAPWRLHVLMWQLLTWHVLMWQLLTWQHSARWQHASWLRSQLLLYHCCSTRRG